MELRYIKKGSSLYKEAVSIRKELFFKNMKNSSDLIQDTFEKDSIHIVCLYDDEVVGTGRLNIENKTSIISQMAIKTNSQNQGIGIKILNELIGYSKNKGVLSIKLSARETAIAFYEKFKFVAYGNKYPSKKTGIIHQEMVLKID